MISDRTLERSAPQWPTLLRILVAFGAAAFLGLLGGVLSAQGRPELTAIFIGLVIVALVISSRTAVFWSVVIGGMVVTGVLQLYLPGSRYVRYVVPLAALALLLHWVMDRLGAQDRNHSQRLPGPMLWGLAFALVGLISVLINLSNPAVAVMGMKDYFQMWAFFLGVVFMPWGATFGNNLFRGFILIALLQLPFVAHEYLVLVPQREWLGEGTVPVDIVAGSFGASMYGGGATGVLAAFMVTMIGCLMALWKNGAISTFKASALSFLFLMPMLVNEAKIVVLYVPLAFVVVFYRDIIAKPLKFLIAGLAMAGILAALMSAIMLGQPSDKFQTWRDLVDVVVARQTAGIEERHGDYGELSRVTALTFWAKEHVTANPINTLLGHGLGASREREGGLGLAETLAEKHYTGLNIGYTALSALLWDTGIIGLATVLGMFASAFITAGRLSRHYRGKDAFKTGLFEGLQAGTAVLALSLASRDYFISHLPFQTFLYLVIGFIGYSWLQVARDERQKALHEHGSV
jgi:hypothetical protein